MLNACPGSVGHRLVDTTGMLRRPEFRDVFSSFYVLSTFSHSDLDRGFSIIDYDGNEDWCPTATVKRRWSCSTPSKRSITSDVDI
jgi:hypothetical protein